jgi:hypothetical protein
MQKARAFFYVCAGLFLLALSYHLGARSATAQAGSSVTGFAWANSTAGCGPELLVLTTNGDVFRRSYNCGPLTGPAILVGNFWGGPTPAQVESWGAVKSRYRGQPRPTPTDR